jgi:uncharacterized protein (DUF1499 family)
MKVVWFIVLLAFFIAVLVFLAGQFGFLKGNVPSNLGVTDGKLKPPARTPNSVSSQSGLYPDHPQAHYAAIAPLEYQGDANTAMDKLAEVVKAQSGMVIVSHANGYLYAQSTTKLLRFTDDVEFWLDTANQKIQVRSSSRIGRKDFGVNRKRIETIRTQFQSS